MVSRQEIVEVTGQVCARPDLASDRSNVSKDLADTAVRLVFKGIPIEVTNAASGNTLTNVLKVLEAVC